MAKKKRQHPSLIKTFWLRPTGAYSVSLRRWSSADCNVNSLGYHNARVAVDDSDVADTDPRWPTHCICGYAFTEGDRRQNFPRRIYERTDTGELMFREDAPAGALWEVDWIHDPNGEQICGADGLSIACRTPGGLWYIDSRASNCTKPDDNEHNCWVRHGTYGEPLHVDKNGLTCKAGAGSIQAGSYHGFLHFGYLSTQRLIVPPDEKEYRRWLKLAHRYQQERQA